MLGRMPEGRPMQKRAAYRELAKFNRRIAEGRDRVALQRARGSWTTGAAAVTPKDC